MLCVTLAGAGLCTDCLDAHALHQRAQVEPTNLDSLALQLPAHHASAHERVFLMQRVDASDECQIDLTGRTLLVMHGTAADLTGARKGINVATKRQSLLAPAA